MKPVCFFLSLFSPRLPASVYQEDAFFYGLKSTPNSLVREYSDHFIKQTSLTLFSGL